MTPGEKIRRRRNKLGLTQKDVVQRVRDLGLGIKIDEPTVSNIENGLRASADHALVLCLALDVESPEELGITISDQPRLALWRDERIMGLLKALGWSANPGLDLPVSGAA